MNGINRLIAVTQLKAENANDGAVKVANQPANQESLGKSNRMFEMYSKIVANAHEMKKALIGNFPR